MRIIVLLNPTNKKGTKKEYTEYRNLLVSDGYRLLQSEVFMRIIKNRKSMQKHINKLKDNLPTTGEIRMITLTEKQYSKIVLFQEIEDKQETKIGNKEYISL